MISKLILFVLPAVVFANIKIEISGNFDPSKAGMVLNFSGSDMSLISDTEVQAFDITEANLKYSALQQFGLAPDHTYIKSPHFWGDMYQINKWTQLTRIVKPSNARILKVSAQPQIVVQQVFTNNHTVPIVYDVDISHVTELITTSRWTNNSKLNVMTDITYDFRIDLMNSGGVMSISFTSPWGANTEMKQIVNTGSASSVQVPVLPGETVTAQLHGLTATVSFAIGYVANVAGDVVAQYDAEYKGHKFWELPVTKAMSIAGLEDHVTCEEVMEITFISHSTVVISDKVTSVKMTKVVV